MTTKQEPSTVVIEIPKGSTCRECQMYVHSSEFCSLLGEYIYGKIKCDPCKQKQKVEVIFL